MLGRKGARSGTFKSGTGMFHGFADVAFDPRGSWGWRAWSAAVEGRDKQDVVVRLNLIGFFPLELPVGIVNEHQNAGAAAQVSMQVDEKRMKRGMKTARHTYGCLGQTARPVDPS